MASINTYKVHYHGSANGKKTTEDRYAYIQAADGKYDTLKAVLSSNVKLPSGTLEITSVANVGPDVTASGVIS